MGMTSRSVTRTHYYFVWEGTYFQVTSLIVTSGYVNFPYFVLLFLWSKNNNDDPL